MANPVRRTAGHEHRELLHQGAHSRSAAVGCDPDGRNCHFLRDRRRIAIWGSETTGPCAFEDHRGGLPDPGKRPALDSAAARCCGPLRAGLEAGGAGLANLDTMIAAHALARGSILITHDKAFARVKGLALEDWTK